MATPRGYREIINAVEDKRNNPQIAFGEKPPVNPLPKANANDLAGTLREKVFGQTPTDYRGTFQQGFETLGQTGEVNPNVVTNGTIALADAFIEQMQKQTGKLPSEDQVRQFVATTLDRGFASEFIRGIPKDSIVSNYVSPYLKSNINELNPSTETNSLEKEIASRNSGLSARLDDLFNRATNTVSGRINREFNDQRGRAIEEEAALGRLRSPVSIPTIARIDENRNRSLSDAFGQLAGQRASGEMDLSKTIEGILAGERRAKEQGNQFNQELGLRRDMLKDQRNQYQDSLGLQRQQIGLAERIGKMQADASGDDWLDYVNTAINTAGTVANFKNAFFKPK